MKKKIVDFIFFMLGFTNIALILTAIIYVAFCA